MKIEKRIKKFISIENLLLDSPLYEPHSIDEIKIERFDIMMFAPGAYDIYCLECKQVSIFKSTMFGKQKGSGYGLPNPSPFLNKSSVDKAVHKDRDVTINLVCSRNSSHLIKYYLRIKNNVVMKIGQHPSLADLKLKELKKYDKVLKENLLKEYARAIGLYAHGIGIGSFVYLRRIFEYLIDDAHKNAREDKGWNEDIYQKSRIDERIKLLKSYLPDTLTSNSSMYSIMSKGIHNLEEEECLEYFNTLKLGIELILDQKIEKQKKEKQTKQFEKEISKIHSKLKS